MNSVEVLLLNALLYTLTLFYFYFKYKMSVGVIVWVLYTVSAWSSFLFIQQPNYASSIHASEQTLLPCIYLYIVLVLAMAPLMRVNKIQSIDFTNYRILKYIIIVCTAIQIMFFLLDIPAMLRVIQSGSGMLKELRSTVYGGDESISLLSQNAVLNRLKNLFSGIRVLATGLSVITFFACKKDRKLIIAFAISALLNNIRIIIVQIGRGEMILIFLLYVCTIYMMRDWINERAKRKIFIIGLPIVIIGGSFFWTISVSRFGKYAGFFMYKYLGEPINNFNGLLFNNIKGMTGGRAYFATFYELFSGEKAAVNANEKWQLIQSMTGIRGDIFYTWVGGLVIEFGKIMSFFVAGILNRLLNRLSRIKEYYSGDLFVILFFLNFYIRGIFNFPTQNLEGMLMILYTSVLYIVFRVRKVDGRLLFRLPSASKSHRR